MFNVVWLLRNKYLLLIINTFVIEKKTYNYTVVELRDSIFMIYGMIRPSKQRE